MADRVVRVRMVADVGSYKRDMGEAARATGGVADQAGRTGTQVGGMSSGVQGAAKSVSDFRNQMLGIVGAGYAVGNAINASVQAASDLEQSIGATSAVFGDASDTVDRYARNSVESVGLSERAYRDLAAVAGAQLKNLGFSQAEAADQGNVLIGIGADLAATFGGTTQEAVEALGAAFRGEADPAERFGLRLNQNAVNAKAVELGLAASTSQVSAAAKGQATLALILEQTADAQGQFAREADTLAVKQQKLNAQWEDAKAALGEQLMPTVAGATGELADLLAVVTDPGWGAVSEAAMGGLANSMRALTLGIVDVNDAMGKEGEAQRLNAELHRIAGLAADDQRAALDKLVESGLLSERQADRLADKFRAEGSASRESADESRRHAEAADRDAEAQKRRADATEAVTDATLAALHSDFAYRESVDDTTAAVGALSDGEGKMEDDMRAAERAVLGQADAAVRLAGDNARAAGQTFGAAQQAAVYRDELLKLRQRFPELTPVIDTYLGRLAAIRPSITTAVYADVAGALSNLDKVIAKTQNMQTFGYAIVPVHGFAQGGVLDGQAKMMGAGPALFQWREPETGGEAFIPLAASKRSRSVDILSDVASRFGMALIANAEGGIYGRAQAGPGMAEMIRQILAFSPVTAGAGVPAMMQALRAVFPGLALLSGYRPGAITATGNASYHGMMGRSGPGRATDVPPRMDVFNWLAGNYPNSTELIFSPAGKRQLRHGQQHFYGEPTRGDHWDHVHWAMAQGGILGNNGSSPINLVTQLVVDGAVLAETVRLYNRNNYGRAA